MLTNPFSFFLLRRQFFFHWTWSEGWRKRHKALVHRTPSDDLNWFLLRQDSRRRSFLSWPWPCRVANAHKDGLPAEKLEITLEWYLSPFFCARKLIWIYTCRFTLFNCWICITHNWYILEVDIFSGDNVFANIFLVRKYHIF